MKSVLSVVFLVSASVGSVFSQKITREIDVQIQPAPQPVTIEGRSVAYYELRITNLLPDTIQLTAVSVSETRNLLALDGEELKKKTGGVTLAPKAGNIIYVEVPVTGGRRLHHVIEYSQSHAGKNTRHRYEHPSVEVSTSAPPVLGAPLGEGSWAAIYEPAWARGHRRVVFTIDGVEYIPGRFAIDFVRLDSTGRYASGNENEIANWYGYNNPVHAVADGVVVATRTDFAESPTLFCAHPVYASADATGNYVAIDIGNGSIVFCEHLKPGSITVVKGQKIRKGDVIGAVGFTGQSTGPHLHLHVANHNAPLAAEGIPFVFDSFRLLGRYPDFGVFGKKPWVGETVPTRVIKERPAPNVVVGFIP